jgi:hypothetical protein
MINETFFIDLAKSKNQIDLPIYTIPFSIPLKIPEIQETLATLFGIYPDFFPLL